MYRIHSCGMFFLSSLQSDPAVQSIIYVERFRAYKTPTIQGAAEIALPKIMHPIVIYRRMLST